MVDHYAVLGVDPDADRATIEHAYRRRVKAVHPDRNDAPDADEQFKRVQEAREVLTDPEARARYDRRRERRTATEGASASADGGEASSEERRSSGRSGGRSPREDGASRASSDGAPSDGGVDAERWADLDPEGWVRAGQSSEGEREAHARQRRRRRHRDHAGSEWEVGEAPEWYSATAEEVTDDASGRRRRGDVAVVSLTALYALVVAVAATPLPLAGRLVVGAVSLLSVVFVLRMPEVAVPVVGVGATVVLPVLALLGLPVLSPGIVVGVLAAALPMALAALFVRLR